MTISKRKVGMNQDKILLNQTQRQPGITPSRYSATESLLLRTCDKFNRMWNLRAHLLLTMILFITSCGYIMHTDIYPISPKGPLKVWVGEGTPTSAGACEFSFRPPTGDDWQMPPGKWGPVAFRLGFVRVIDKLFMRRTESITVYSLEDTLLWDANPAYGEWLRKLLGDCYSWEEMKELKLTVETIENIELETREYLVVHFTTVVHFTLNAKPIFSRGVAYVMKSPCDLWSGLIVFLLVDSKYGGPPHDPFSSTGAVETLTGMVRSFTFIKGTLDEQ